MWCVHSRPRGMARLAIPGLVGVVSAVVVVVAPASPAGGVGLPLAGRLVFSCSSCPGAPTGPRLFTVEPDGTGLRMVPLDEDASEPRWSADGRTIAFTRDFRSVWRVRDDGTALHRVTRPPRGTQDSAPGWSPDRKRIVFVRAVPPPGAGSYRTSLQTIGVDGRDRRPLRPPVS